MEIYEKEALIKFYLKHAIVKKTLELWYNDVKSKKWKSTADVKKDYTTVSIINRNRVVFNIKGNSYRLIADINFDKGWVVIRFIGTHSEYDKIDAATIDKYKF